MPQHFVSGFAPGSLDGVVPKGTIVAITFAETVQAGIGGVDIGGTQVSVTSSALTPSINRLIYFSSPRGGTKPFVHRPPRGGTKSINRLIEVDRRLIDG